MVFKKLTGLVRQMVCEFCEIATNLIKNALQAFSVLGFAARDGTPAPALGAGPMS